MTGLGSGASRTGLGSGRMAVRDKWWILMGTASTTMRRAKGLRTRGVIWSLALGLASLPLAVGMAGQARAEDPLPWKSQTAQSDYDVYREQPQGAVEGGGYESDRDSPPTYVPPRIRNNGSQSGSSSYGSGSAYNRGPDVERSRRAYVPQREDAAPRREYAPRYDDRADNSRYERYEPPRDGSNDPGRPVERYEDYRDPGAPPQAYSQDEILKAGHNFFGSISQGLAKVVEKAFDEQGRPNGYILGEDAGGAFIAGLRYGEGTLYTRDYGSRKVYWQGPTLGYDFGAEGSKTMVLVYNLRHPDQIYGRFGGVQGAAYVVGGVGLQVMKRDDVTLAPIRSGVGLRLGANVGYLKYTRSPTWNPF